MIAESKRAAVLRLHNQGESTNAIIERTGVPRSTVNDIAQRGRKCRSKVVRVAERCPGCGGMVVLPCLGRHAESRKITRAIASALAQGRSEGEGYIFWEKMQSIKGDERKSFIVVDCGEFRVCYSQ